MLTSDIESDEDTITLGSLQFNSEWNIFVVLMWRNIRVMWRHWEQVVMTILMPILFCSILVVLKIYGHHDAHPTENYAIVELSNYWDELMSLIDERKAKIKGNISNPFIPEKIVGYAPNILGYENIMKGASDHLQSLVLNSYNTCDHLKSAIIKDNLFAGVCFDSLAKSYTDTYKLVNGLYPNYLKYRLIFPYGCRIYNDTFIGNSWSTNSLFHFINRTYQRNIGHEDGGYVGYIREGFAPLQNAISLSYLKLVAAAMQMSNFKMPKIVMCRYPTNEFIDDDIVESVDITMALTFVFGNFYPVLMIAARIVEEKESILKYYSKVMGVNNFLRCLAWICNYLLRALISSLVIVTLLKINWSSGTSILERSNFFAVLVVISVYNIASISFVLMLSNFFTQRIFAGYGIALIWFFSYIPYIMFLSEDETSIWGPNVWLVIFHNTTFGIVMETIAYLEIYSEGLRFSNFFSTGSLKWQLSIGCLVCIMLMQCFLYICISLYMVEIMPDNFGLAKRWFFLFADWKSAPFIAELAKPSVESVSMGSDGSAAARAARAASFIYEIGEGNSKVLVQMHNVCKNYGDELVLKDINMELYDNRITVILGHNGSGKTTLLKMMCGLSSITSGSIIIDGFDVSSDERYACASVGLCLGNTLLYPDLIVEDQIRYFGYLKGLQRESVELELENYLQATNLSDYRMQQANELPMGVLQKLAICCALVGQSRVVLLDDPITHMDLPARTLIWNLLEREKLDRAILITSTSASILEGVGDRVIILSNRQLQCDGTPAFLRKMYGQGYKLILSIGPQCNIKDVTRKVRQFIPHITPLSSLGNEITYDLQENDTNILDELTYSLQSSMSFLGIESVTLRATNIDDIFFKLAAASPSYDNRSRLAEILNGESSYPRESKHLRFMEITERVTGIRRTLQHFQAMWSQRIIYAIHFKFYFITRLILPSLSVLMAFFISPYSIDDKPMPVIEFSLDQYLSSVTLIERRNLANVADPIIERYKQLIFWLSSNHKVVDIGDALLPDYYLNKDLDKLQRLDHHYHVGVTFTVDYIIAWFNNVALHSVPLSLNLVHNAILRVIYGDDCGIEIALDPLNNMLNYRDSQLRTQLSTSHIMPLCISMCVCCIWNTIAFIFVRERISGYDKAQIVAGTTFLTYWCVNISYDTVVIALTSVLTTLTIMVYQYQTGVEWDIYFCYAAVFMLCGLCVYAFNYMIALLFVSPSHAFTFSLFVQSFSIICYSHMIDEFETSYVTTAKSPYPPYLLLLPLFCFCSAVTTIYYNGEFYRICHDEHIKFISINLEKCQALPNCCRTLYLYSIEDGVLIEVIVMTATICICWWIILVVHYRYICNCSNMPEDDYYAQLNDHKRRHDDTRNYHFSEFSTFQEQYEIQKMRNAQLRTIPLICDRLGKKFGDKVAVDRVSLILHRFACFGILGIAGSGVTTLFNLIAGFKEYSYGRILIKGRSAINNSHLVQKMIGYGRQEMINFPEFTMKNVLEHECKLRSYPPQYMNEICVNLAKVLGLFPYYHKQLSDLSLGLLNRLNCAVTVMGNPEIILLDMAICGIDSAGVRELWNVLKRMQSKGATILFSSTMLRDCERYCTRVGFMSHGRFCLIGTPWSLSTVIADSYYLKGNFNRPTSVESSNYLYTSDQNKLTNFIYKLFPNSVVKQLRRKRFIFLIPVQSCTISQIITTLMRNADSLNIEDFELTHSLLSESFIAFWEKEFELTHPDNKFD